MVEKFPFNEIECREYGGHCWEELTSNLILPSFPAQSPPKKRRCKHCKTVERLVVEHNEYWGVELNG